ncbi:MAG: hypothetical protein ACPGED_12920 [Flavobacteriales bacterium]
MFIKKQIDAVSRPIGYNIHAWKVIKKIVLTSIENKEKLSRFKESQTYNWEVLSKFNHLFQST